MYDQSDMPNDVPDPMAATTKDVVVLETSDGEHVQCSQKSLSDSSGFLADLFSLPASSSNTLSAPPLPLDVSAAALRFILDINTSTHILMDDEMDVFEEAIRAADAYDFHDFVPLLVDALVRAKWPASVIFTVCVISGMRKSDERRVLSSYRAILDKADAIHPWAGHVLQVRAPQSYNGLLEGITRMEAAFSHFATVMRSRPHCNCGDLEISSCENILVDGQWTTTPKKDPPPIGLLFDAWTACADPANVFQFSPSATSNKDTDTSNQGDLVQLQLYVADNMAPEMKPRTYISQIIGCPNAAVTIGIVFDFVWARHPFFYPNWAMLL